MAWESLSKREVQRDRDWRASCSFCGHSPWTLSGLSPLCARSGGTRTYKTVPGVGGLVP